MARPKGTKNIKTPEEFLQLWDDYKASVDAENYKEEVLSNKGEIAKLNRPNPYLRRGFEAFVYRQRGFHIHQYIDNDDKAYNDYLGVVTCARREWETDQISGSLTGKYKAPNLVARLNGLVDKREVKAEINPKPMFGKNPLEGE